MITHSEKIENSGGQHAERGSVLMEDSTRKDGKTENTILIVNDTSDQLEMMSLILRKSGYRVSIAIDGREGFEAAQAEHPDLIVSDVSMPRMDGIEMCRLIRENRALRLTPVLLVSAIRKDSESVIEGLKAGADDYLEAPYDPMRLITKIAQLIERKHAEERLHESEERYRVVAETATDAIITIDENSTMLFVNKSVERVFGYTVQELQGRQITLLMPAYLRHVHEVALGKYVQTGRKHINWESVELPGLHKSGREIPLELSFGEFVKNGKHFFTGIARDITERKRAEETRLHLASIVESSEDAIIGKTLNGIVTSWNAGAENIYGYTAEEAVGRHISFIIPPERVGELAEIIKSIGRDERLKHLETMRVRKDGAQIDVSISISPIKDIDGQIIGASVIARDITERKRAEGEVRKQKEVLQKIFDHIPVMISFWDEDGRLKLVNQEWERTLGWSLEEIEKQKLDILAECYPDPQYRQKVLDFITTAKGEWTDLQPRSRDGRVIDTTWAAVNLSDGESVSIGQDISERKRAEQKLRESEERYRDTVENARDIIYSHDLEGNYTSINKACEQITGYTHEEALRLNMIQTVAPEYQEKARQMIIRKLAGEKVTAYDLEIIAKDGRRIAIEVNSRIILRDGIPISVQGIARDLTERKRSEEILRFQKTLLESQSEASPDGILVVASDGRIISYNSRFVEMWGIPEEVMESHSDKIALRAVEDNLINPQEFLETVAHLYKHPDEVHHGEITLKDNRAFERYSAPVKSRDGEYYGRVWFFRDITERKQLEEQFRQSQKMEAVGQLAGGIAHDFNNLLTAITGYSELSLRRLQAEDPLHSNLQEIKKAGERAASLTRQLLAFSRKQVLQPKVLVLNSIISDVEKMLSRLIGEDIELRTVLEPQLGSIKADPGQIEQVLLNLAVNARDAMPHGGKLTIETANVYLDGEYAAQHIAVNPGHYVMLAFSDTGCGMDEKTQARIFEPFFTTKEAGKGTGLGLSTVYGIVKQSGGNIWVYSEVGIGTTFKVYLPRVDEGAQEFKRSTDTEEALSGSEIILLAEDEEVVRKLAREVLEMYGYQVLEAANGGAALLICENHIEPIHLLLTDVIMPEMSGHKLADRLKQLRPEMKVLYMSGYTDNAIVHQGLLDEGTNFIQKPFVPDALARKLREVLDEEVQEP